MLYEVDGKPTFRIDLYDHTVANKWKNLIESIYIGDGEDIDHIRTFFPFRTTEEKRKILLDAIESINTFFKKDFIELPENIDWDGQEIFNDLHISLSLIHI